MPAPDARSRDARPPAPALGVGARLDALSLAIALAAFALAVAARRRGLDLPLFLAVNGWRGVPDGVWHLLGIAGLGATALAVVTLGSRARPAIVAALPWILLVGGGLTQALKRAFPSPRPAAVLDAALLHVVGDRLRLGSMPSGHAMTAAAICCVLWIAGGPRWRRLPGAALAGGVAAAIGMSRVATGSHWPTDVAAGAGLGWAVACASLHLARVTRTEAFLASRAGQWALGAAQVGCGAAIASDASYPPALPVQWALGALAFGAGMATLARRCAPAVAARARTEVRT